MWRENGKAENITLEIVEKVWSGGVDFGREVEPVIEEKEVNTGDTIALGNDVWGYANITIRNITNDGVLVYFDTEGIVRENPDGTINLLSDEHNWTANIRFNEEYRIVTQTLSSGMNWTLTFKR